MSAVVAPYGRLAWLWVSAATLLAALFALFDLAAKSFWLDEAASVHYADVHRGVVAVAAADGGNFALYYLLLHEWLRLGSSDGFVRLLSVIFALIAIPSTYALGQKLFGVRAAIIAAFLLAVNAFFVAYAQEARGYSLFLLVSTVSSLCYLRMIESGRWSDIGAYALTSVILAYIHLFGFLVLAAQMSTLLAYGRGNLTARRVWSCYAAIAIAVLPLLLLAHRHGARSIDWIPQLSFATLARFFIAVTGGMLGFFTYALCCGYAFVAGRSANAREFRRALGIVALWIVVPLSICMLFSLLIRPLFEPRYLISIVPLLAILAGAGVSCIRARPAMIAVLLLFALASALGLKQYYAAPKEDWRDAAAFIASQTQPGDIIVCTPSYAAVPLQHALDQLALPQRLVVYPGVSPAALRSRVRFWVVVREEIDVSAGTSKDLAAQARALTFAISEGRSIALQRSFFRVAVTLFER